MIQTAHGDDMLRLRDAIEKVFRGKAVSHEGHAQDSTSDESLEDASRGESDTRVNTRNEEIWRRAYSKWR